jgi:hypothetical protein
VAQAMRRVEGAERREQFERIKGLTRLKALHPQSKRMIVSVHPAKCDC